MPSTNAATTRGTVATRPGASRKLLTAKAAAKVAGATPFGEPLEASFPAAEPDDAAALVVSAADALPAFETALTGRGEVHAQPATADAPVAGESVLSEQANAPADHVPVAAPTWSEAEENAYQAMATRRKASGYQRRGRDVGGQILRVGDIAPNPGTVVAKIVQLVSERGTVSRGNLVAAMAQAVFPHPKARPTATAWCVGYVAGGIRGGFLVVAAPSEQGISAELPR